MIAVVVAITFIRAIKCTIHYTTDYTLTNGVTFENIYLQLFDNFAQNIFQNITQ